MKTAGPLGRGATIDIVDRLRHFDLPETDSQYRHEVAGRAADEIDRLRAALRALLEQFEHVAYEGRSSLLLDLDVLDQARAALAEETVPWRFLTDES